VCREGVQGWCTYPAYTREAYREIYTLGYPPREARKERYTPRDTHPGEARKEGIYTIIPTMGG